MKKHELLKYAYDNYPKGCVARFKNVPIDRTSNGKFRILVDEGGVHVLGGDNYDCFYNGEEWATIIKNEALKVEKIAVKCNARQSKIVAKHIGLEDVGNFEGEIGIYIKEPSELLTHFSWDFLPNINGNYNIVDFAFWAAQNGVEVPKPILTSEDGVELFMNDYAHHVCSIGGDKYRYNGTFKVTGNVSGHVFHSKEAALAWIEKENKPKSVEVQLFNKYHHAVISKDWVALKVGDPNINVTTTMIKPSDLEDMLHAYKSLQQ